MTIWQSLALVSPWQAAYAVGLVALIGLRGWSFVALVLVADFVALMLILAAMDFGWLIRAPGNDQVLGASMVVWCVTAVAFAVHPAGSLLMAAFSVAGIAMMLISLALGVQVGTTSAIVNALAFVQIAVAAIGSGDSGGAGRRDADRPLSVASSAVHSGSGAGGVVARLGLLSQDRGGQ